MKSSLIELVGEILRQLDTAQDAPFSEKSLRSWLKGQGYSKQDIDAAFKLVAPRLQRPVPSMRHVGSIRQLSLQEAFKLTPEARDALVRLEMFELLSAQELEVLIVHLMQFDGEVGLEELDTLLSWGLSTTRDVETQQAIFGVMEGNAACLN